MLRIDIHRLGAILWSLRSYHILLFLAMFSHYSSFIPLVLVLFVWGTFVTLCVTVTNMFNCFFLFFLHRKCIWLWIKLFCKTSWTSPQFRSSSNESVWYLCVSGIDFASLYDYLIGFWICPDSVKWFVFHFIDNFF